MDNNNLSQELKNAISYLEMNLDKFAPDACERTVFEVLKDIGVQAAIVEILKEGNYLVQVTCKGEHDQIKVTFLFNCVPPKICILATKLVVTYDVSQRKVVGKERTF
jgi:hypothetical protein